ncbi:MAG: DEAD/DEAH box helicase family protein [Chloroflexota bacterium]
MVHRAGTPPTVSLRAEAAKHDLRRALTDLPDWPDHSEPRAGHAVAFPDVDLASLPRDHALLGPDAPREIVLDADALATPESTRLAVDRAYAYWVGDGSRGQPLGAGGMKRVDDYLAPTMTLRRLLRHDVEDDRARLIQASREQMRTLNQSRNLRRVEVVGPAGSGKSILALEKAQRLAREGFRTLVVCFNQPLATAMQREVEEALADDPETAGRLQVTTFHRLCETLGQQAGVLPPRPGDGPRSWWGETLPTALLEAFEAPLRRPDSRHDPARRHRVA